MLYLPGEPNVVYEGEVVALAPATQAVAPHAPLVVAKRDTYSRSAGGQLCQRSSQLEIISLRDHLS